MNECKLLQHNYHYPSSVALLIECCRSVPEAAKPEMLSGQITQWESFTQTASHHGVLPLVHYSLKTLASVPDEIKERLKRLNLEISMRNMLMSAELIRIMKLFEENGIRALAFKGPTLSRAAYGDIALRQFGDLDILIQHSDIALTTDLLMAQGYIPEIELGTDMKETLLDALTVIGFYKSKSNILIEVHWALLSKNYAIQWDEKALWSQAQESVSINNIAIRVLPCEEQLLYLCIHGAKHLFERLEWVCDIDRFIRANPNMDWPYLLSEAKKRGVQRMLFLGLALCQYFFRLQLPELFQTQIAQDKVLPKLISKVLRANFSETSQEGKNYDYFMLMWHMRENLSDKLRFTWYAFFAAQFDDFTFIRLPKQLAFLYPLVRQFRLVTKYFSR
ncbi:nucleotidyltransferase family protein [Sulfurovum sp.]|uniref:nucleotidyltransferase domain-containing protein n=1 Tax=Sulfurovum sp. TaxID=1969726 RepID=UPI002867BF6E|nr:nucleotidyltransferase family protein [Sulfurovum sp.]